MAEVRRSTEAVVHLRSNKIVHAKKCHSQRNRLPRIPFHVSAALTDPPRGLWYPQTAAAPVSSSDPPSVFKLNTPPPYLHIQIK